jgi:NADPH:quinone reductase-like Zn-dependent oxidoreductase/acyl carrier protein
MDPIRGELLSALRGIRPRPATLPFFSTVFGRRVGGEELGPEYWWLNVRQAVRFGDGMAGIIEEGCDVVVELSPHPVLTAAVAECYQHRGKKVTTLQSLRRPAREGRPQEERATMLRSLGSLYALGSAVDWQALHPSAPARFVRLPSYPWQRQRCWHESEESRSTRLFAPAHPLLGSALREPRPTWGGRLDLRLTPWLADHRVQRSALFPATGYLELAFAAAREVFGAVPCELEDVKLANACFLTPEAPLWLQSSFDPETGAVEVHTRPLEKESLDESGTWTRHMTAIARAKSDGSPGAAGRDDQANTFDAVRRRAKREFDGDRCTANLLKVGLDYGPLFQGIVRGWQGDGESLGLVRLPAGLVALAPAYLFHPALLDLCFQVSVVADPKFDDGGGGLYLPTEIDRVRLHRPAPASLWCHARVRSKTPRTGVVDLDLRDEDGRLVAEVIGLRSRRVVGDKAEALDDMLGEYRWQLEPPPESVEAIPSNWLIFADRAGLGLALAGRLREAGGTCLVVPPGEADLERLVAALPSPCRAVVHLWNLDAPRAEGLTTADLEATHEAGLQSVVYLVQAWEKDGGETPARLFVVTRGAQPVEGGAIGGLAQSPAVGLGRVIAGEYPRLRCRLVDLDPRDADCGLHALLDELRIDDDEDEVARRGAGRYLHRFMPVPARPASPAGVRPYRLTAPEDRTLDGLRLRAVRRGPVEPGHVEIEVVAAGLNFSDVMKSLGIYPGLEAGPIPLGAECGGVIAAVGAGVSGLRVGDEVMAVAPFSFGSHAVARAELVVPKPVRMSFEEAATVPIAFLTAAYTLEHLGGMGEGDRVLIHSASGGVGMAALQLARLAGAEVFATAGTPEKREYLRQLGVAHVMDSRSLDFADEVLRDTGGSGVDLILNSLPGAAIARGLDCLADSGRFLEIGKRDIYKNTRVGLRPFRNNLSFFAIDLDRLMRQRPALLGALLRDIASRLSEGSLTPLPHRTWPIADAAEGFRFMQQGKHVGKIVLSLRDRPATLAPAEDESPDLREDASYLITGGLGGFGLSVARWMVERGARHLVLVGRSGAESAQSQRAVADLEGMGARVVVCRADVSLEGDVDALFAEVDRLPPLRGVVHAAMVLEDSLLVNLDRELMRRVLAPKVSGAWNLHLRTRDRPLDFFVLFSSLSSVFGHAGQGNYAAANAFLDALAWHRRAAGLPALTLNWGYLGGVGYLAERSQLGERLERQGVQSFSVRQALALLGRAMARELTQVSVLRIDWSRWRGLGVTGRISPRFAHLCRAATPAGENAPGVLLARDAVLAASPYERSGLLESLLRDKVARILGTGPDRLDAETVLLNLGFDSLMAVELRNWIEGELRVKVPIVELMRSPSVARLREFLGERLADPPTPKGGVHAPAKELSGDEVDALLASLAAKKGSQA